VDVVVDVDDTAGDVLEQEVVLREHGTRLHYIVFLLDNA
jgi:hypothetical protein